MKNRTTPVLLVMSGLLFGASLLSSCQKDILNAKPDENPTTLDMANTSTAAPTSPYYVLDSIGKPQQIFRETINSTTLKNRLKTSYEPTRILPTGYYVAPNQSFTINVNLQQGSTLPKVQVGTHSRNHDYSYNPPVYNLSTGSNTITANADGGIIWITYEQPTNATTAPAASALLSFSGNISRIPVYIKNSTTLSNWQNQLLTYNSATDVLMVGQNVYMVYAKNLHSAVSTQNNDLILNNADAVWDNHYTYAGLNNSSTQHTRPVIPHLMVQTEVPFGLYYAFFYRTAYANYDAHKVFGEDIVTNWGVWHEFGHLMQMQPIDWDGLGEVTVNIFSLKAERALGITPTRLTKDNVWPQVHTYLSNTGTKNFDSQGVWVKLAMFHQLWLAYGDSFYTNLYRSVREDTGTYSSSDAKKKNFILKACQQSGYNLTSFFQAWGIQDNSLNIYNAVAALNLPSPSYDLSQLTDSYTPGQTLIENGSIYQIVSAVNNSSVVDVNSHTPANSTPVTLWSKNNPASNNQKFLARKVSGNQYVFKSMADTTKVLDVQGGGSADGTTIIVYGYHGGNAQRWDVADAGAGYVYLKSAVGANKSLDVKNGATANGTLMQIWTSGTGNSQKFKLIKQ